MLTFLVPLLNILSSLVGSFYGIFKNNLTRFVKTTTHHHMRYDKTARLVRKQKMAK